MTPESGSWSRGFAGSAGVMAAGSSGLGETGALVMDCVGLVATGISDVAGDVA